MQQVNISRCLDEPTILFKQDGHAVYWLGNNEPASAFRTNVYLIRDGDKALLVDPGNRSYFQQVKERVAQIMPPEGVSAMILCHQDPDVAASMIDWLEVNPAMPVLTTARTQVLLPHYGKSDYAYVDVADTPNFSLPSGARLEFIPAPFLHFPGAFASYDAASGFLFSGDIFASLGVNDELWSRNFDTLARNMELFHIDYMASNIAARGFADRLAGLEINAILPQHGCLIGTKQVHPAIHWLASLRCGTDLIYPDLS